MKREDLRRALAEMAVDTGLESLEKAGIPVPLMHDAVAAATEGGFEHAVKLFEAPSRYAVVVGGPGAPDREKSLYGSGIGTGLILGVLMARFEMERRGTAQVGVLERLEAWLHDDAALERSAFIFPALSSDRTKEICVVQLEAGALGGPDAMGALADALSTALDQAAPVADKEGR